MTSHLEDSNVAITDSNIVLHHQQGIHHGKPSKFERATTDAETQSAAIMPENWLSIHALANQAPPVSGQPLPLASTVGGATAFDFGDIIFIYGTEGDDVISWQGGLIVIQGLGGNDQIYGPSSRRATSSSSVAARSTGTRDRFNPDVLTWHSPLIVENSHARARGKNPLTAAGARA